MRKEVSERVNELCRLIAAEENSAQLYRYLLELERLLNWPKEDAA